MSTKYYLIAYRWYSKDGEGWGNCEAQVFNKLDSEEITKIRKAAIESLSRENGIGSYTVIITNIMELER